MARDITLILMLVMPVVIMTIIQDDIVEISLPDGGEKLHDKHIPYYRSMLDLIF